MRNKHHKIKKPLEPALNEALANIKRLNSGDKHLKGIGTGFPQLDILLNGLQAGTLTVIASTPSLGKTALALDIAKNVSLNSKKSVGFLSLDTSEERIITRLLSSESKVPLWRIRTGRIYKGTPSLVSAAKKLANALLFLRDMASPTIGEIQDCAINLHMQEHINLLIIDSLQSIWIDSDTKTLKQFTDLTREIKNIAKVLEIPVILTMTLEAVPTGKRIALDDLRRYGNIEQSSDIIIFLSRIGRVSSDGEKNMVGLSIEQNRCGRIGRADLCFNDELASFEKVPAISG